MLRKIASASVTSPFVASCIDSFREAYARTGMNLLQSIVVAVVAIGQRSWRGLRRRSPRR